jgi:hypothetical protein
MMKAIPAMAIGSFSSSDILSVLLQTSARKMSDLLIVTNKMILVQYTHVAKKSSGSESRVSFWRS